MFTARRRGVEMGAALLLWRSGAGQPRDEARWLRRLEGVKHLVIGQRRGDGFRCGERFGQQHIVAIQTQQHGRRTQEDGWIAE